MFRRNIILQNFNGLIQHGLLQHKWHAMPGAYQFANVRTKGLNRLNVCLGIGSPMDIHPADTGGPEQIVTHKYQVSTEDVQSADRMALPRLEPQLYITDGEHLPTLDHISNFARLESRLPVAEGDLGSGHNWVRCTHRFHRHTVCNNR